MAVSKPELKVTVFSDYICPFCYIGDARLNRLRTRFELKVNWCFLEIHPETPPEGRPVRELGYDPQFGARPVKRVIQREVQDRLADLKDDNGLGYCNITKCCTKVCPEHITITDNDTAGVTGESNLNMSRHLNRKFASNFDLGAFEHRATYRPDEGRVVVELVSTREQEARIGDARIDFRRDESIITEYSHKYTLDDFAAMANQAGFSVDTVWTDARDWFSVQYCTRK